MKSGTCPKCKSTEIIVHASPIATAGVTRMTLEIHSFDHPNAFLMKGERRSTASAWVCGGCGFVELYADDPAALITPS